MMLLERTIQATPSRKVLWAVAVSMPMLLILLVVSHVALDVPEIRAGIHLPTLRGLQCVFMVTVCLQLAVVLWVWPRPERPLDMALPALINCLVVGLAYSSLAMACGLFTDSANMVLLGLLAVGLLLFERLPMLITFIVCTMLHWAHDWGVYQHWWRYAPLWQEPLFQGREPVWWLSQWRSWGFWSSYTILTALVLWLFSELDEMHARLRVLSHTDPLTGLFNRRRFMESLAHELARQSRTHEPLSLVLIDADHFKDVNDTHGHDMGDDVLCALAGLLQDCVRSPTDLACRLGGEEFALILPDTDRTQAMRVCGRVRELLAAMQFGETGQRFRLTVSMGVVECFGESVADCLREADAQLYRAKTSGRDRVSAAPSGWGQAHG
jgi:diguanylate cyclase (GGDEF)-like protein